MYIKNYQSDNYRTRNDTKALDLLEEELGCRRRTVMHDLQGLQNERFCLLGYRIRAAGAKGNQAGLVVLATGLGKTWLTAFDSVRFEAKRVLFVALREEILRQSL